MHRYTLLVRISPMVLNAFYSAALGIILPQMIAFYGLTLNQGGFLVGAVQSAGVASLLLAGYFLDRKGATNVLMISLIAAALGGLGLGLAPSFTFASAALIVLGMSMTAASSSTNALMAQTGSRRAFYLGLMHASFSFLSMIAPVLAGLLVAYAPWQHYYRWFTLIALVILVASWHHDGPPRLKTNRSPAHGWQEEKKQELQDGEGTEGAVAWHPPWWRFSSLWRIGIGVFFMAGTQATLATWAYSFMQDVYGSPHDTATLGASLFWAGILAGRLLAMALSPYFTERTLLVTSALVALVSLFVSWFGGSIGLALVSLVFFGYGTSGAFQLGTSWAAGILPARVGTASSIVMTGASAGGLILPTLAAFLAADYTFLSLRWIILVGFLVSMASFGSITPTPSPSYSGRSAAA